MARQLIGVNKMYKLIKYNRCIGQIDISQLTVADIEELIRLGYHISGDFSKLDKKTQPMIAEMYNLRSIK
jgi:hypothetical protein